MDLESYELVLLRRPADAPKFDEDTTNRIHAEHLAFHARLREEGTVVTNGPFRGHPDQSMRGMTFYRTGSTERARELAEQDPAVRAGRLAVDVLQWLCPAGTMIRPGHPVNPT